MKDRFRYWPGFVAAVLWGQCVTLSVHAAAPSDLERLGKQLFFDESLSNPPGQSCASCHTPEVGFTGPDSRINAREAIYPGADPRRHGNRKPPTVSYAKFSPPRKFQGEDGFVGGQFWDGRADDLVAQAQGPLLNPLEMNNPNAAAVVAKLRRSTSQPLFDRVFGGRAATADVVLRQVAEAIAAYESSAEVNPFRSRYDAYLASGEGLSPKELRGLALFEVRAKCQKCHPNRPTAEGEPPLFTDFTYDNLGVPRNRDNPFYRATREVNPEAEHYRDPGLRGAVPGKVAGFDGSTDELAGKFKVPTLRNVAKRPTPGFVKAYMHNGVFKSLREVVHFYNVRDTQPNLFPPETPENVNVKELGRLELTAAEEDDIVAFLETLSDQDVSAYSPAPVKPISVKESSPRESTFPWEVIRVQRFLDRRGK